MKKTMTVVTLMLGWVFAAQAQEGKIKGYMFGDYYYVLAADETDTKRPRKRNAFQFRRLYLTYQSDIATDFAIRFRLEAKDAGFAQGSKMEPFVKHGYLQWKEGLGDADIYLGLSGTPTWAVAEKVWGYRSVAKTVLDWNKIGSSADLGAASQGRGRPVALPPDGRQWHRTGAGGRPRQKILWFVEFQGWGPIDIGRLCGL